jgi:hypothetical protein
MRVLWGVGGMLVLSAISALLSTIRRAINLRTVVGALDDQGASHRRALLGSRTAGTEGPHERSGWGREAQVKIE